jgi:CoA:oxalate CoA-transferase
VTQAAGTRKPHPPAAPLSGMKVVDFSEAVPGPFFTRCLLDLGATVTKIERPARDVAHNLQPAVYQALNGGKTVHLLDLKQDADKAKALDIALESDVLVDGFRPGVMDRLGLGYREISRHRPEIIYVSLTGYGQDGPYASAPGHDLNYLAVSGLLALSGEISPGNATGAPVGDLASSMYAIAATLAAFIQRMTTGTGQHLDVSITDCLTHWMNTVTPNLRANGRTTIAECRAAALTKPAYGAFKTADDEWIAIAAVEDKFWHSLVTALDLDVHDIPTGRRAERIAASERINDEISRAVARLPAQESLDLLQAADVPVSRVVSPVEVADTANARARDLFEERNGVTAARFPVCLPGLGRDKPGIIEEAG